MANIKLKNANGTDTLYSGITNITVKNENDQDVSFIIPSGNQDITTLNEYNVTDKATARISAGEREKIIAENIKKDVSILGVTGTFEGSGSNSVSTQSQSIFTGWTAPLTYLNSTDNVFEYKSATHNITISGLNNIATISGNGTKNVTVAIDITSTSDRQTAFTITCSNNGQSLTYNGIAFHYGVDVADGNCLAVAQTLINEQIGYIFIESSSLPSFSSVTTLWNNIYSYQIISFNFAKSNVTNIVMPFKYCYSFNQPIIIPDGVTNIYYLISYCNSFNQPIVIPNHVSSITGLVSNCSSFNQPVTIPNSVKTLENFLEGCYSFNQPIILPSSLTKISGNLLYGCYSFNQPLTIPSSVTRIYSNFLYNCYSFNQPLTIPSSVTRIDNYFLYNCYSFNQPLTIPSSITNIGSYFLYGCYSFIYLDYNASVYPSDNNSLSQTTNSKTSGTGTGIFVTGTGAEGLKAALPNRTSSPYRKLV